MIQISIASLSWESLNNASNEVVPLKKKQKTVSTKKKLKKAKWHRKETNHMEEVRKTFKMATRKTKANLEALSNIQKRENDVDNDIDKYTSDYGNNIVDNSNITITKMILSFMYGQLYFRVLSNYSTLIVFHFYDS